MPHGTGMIAGVAENVHRICYRLGIHYPAVTFALPLLHCANPKSCRSAKQEARDKITPAVHMRFFVARASVSAASIFRNPRTFHIPKHNPANSRPTNMQSSKVDHFWRFPESDCTILCP